MLAPPSATSSARPERSGPLTQDPPPLDRRLHRQPGDGWVECACGSRHWGLHGAAGLLLVRPGDDSPIAPRGPAIVLQHRALWSDQGGTWGVPGGALGPGEPAHVGAIREAVEEAGLTADAVRPLSSIVLDHGPWSYTTVVAELTPAFLDLEPAATDAESLEVAWVPVEAVAGLPLLPAFADAWPVLRRLLGRRLVLVVDDPANTELDLSRLANEGVRAADLGLPLPAGGAARPDSPFSAVTRWWPEVLLGPGPGSGSAATLDLAEQLQASRPDDVVLVVTADPVLGARAEATALRTVGPTSLR